MHIRVFLRVSIALVAIVTTFTISGTAVSTNAHAQGIAVPPIMRLTIPDLPCAYSSELRQLQKLSDEYDLSWRQLSGLVAQLGQLEASPEYKQFVAANNFIHKGFYETSDEFKKFEEAKAIVKRLRPLDQKVEGMRDAFWRLFYGRQRLEGQFKMLIASIQRRKCAQEMSVQPELQPHGVYKSVGMHFGLTLGGAALASIPTSSSSGFYTGGTDNSAAFMVGASAFYDLATFGNAPGPFGKFVLSGGVVTDYIGGGALAWHGSCGGFPCDGRGSVTQWNVIGEAKLTTPLSSWRSTANVYVGAGVSTLWPTGMPTGPFGPQFQGSATAPAIRVGLGYDYQFSRNWAVGGKVGFQHTYATEYDTTLRGERFRLNYKDEMIFGVTMTYTPTTFP